MKHAKGEKCNSCCCTGPYKCVETEACNGYIHEELVDDDPEEGYIHIYRCDTCNFETKYWADEDTRIEF